MHAMHTMHTMHCIPSIQCIPCVPCIQCNLSLIHSLIHSFVRSLVHSFINPFIHSFIHAFMHSCIHAFIYSFMHACIHSFIHSFIHSLTHLFTHSLTHLFIHPSIHSFIHPFIRSFTHTLVTSSINSFHLKRAISAFRRYQNLWVWCMWGCSEPRYSRENFMLAKSFHQLESKESRKSWPFALFILFHFIWRSEIPVNLIHLMKVQLSTVIFPFPPCPSRVSSGSWWKLLQSASETTRVGLKWRTGNVEHQ